MIVSSASNMASLWSRFDGFFFYGNLQPRWSSHDILPFHQMENVGTWESTLNLYLRAPTKYGLYSSHGGIFGEQTARAEYPGVPTFFFWLHRLLFTSWYVRFNKTEFLWLLMDPSIKPSVRERLKELLQPLIFLLLPRSIARIAMQDQNTHATILDFMSFSGKFHQITP